MRHCLNYKVLNLFLALLLSSFGIDKLKIEEKDDEINNIQEAIDRIKRYFKSIFWSVISIPYFRPLADYIESLLARIKRMLNHRRAHFFTKDVNDAYVSRWSRIKEKAYNCVEHKYFESFIILLIVLSSVSLVTFYFMTWL